MNQQQNNVEFDKIYHLTSEACLGPRQTSMINAFCVKIFKVANWFYNGSIIDIWKSPNYASEHI